MKYPTIRELQTTRDWVNVFGGYNHNLRISDSEFYEMKNMTGDDYPTLSPRRKRGIYLSPNDITKDSFDSIIAKENLCWVEKTAENGTTFYVNGYENNFKLDDTDDPKTLISMGAHVIVLPDKKYINTENMTMGDINAKFVSNTSVSYLMCQLDGNTGTPQNTPPELNDGQINGSLPVPLWIDTSVTPNLLKQYSKSKGEWSSIATTYTRIELKGAPTDIDNFADFSVGDGVAIRGSEIDALNGYFVIQSKGNNFITVMATIEEVTTQENPVTIRRDMPEMDYVVESNNRLWGCKYGVIEDIDGVTQVVNTIYASKLGDFKNWNAYPGTAADSYFVGVGSDGKFTGAATHLGYPIFFKENCIHKIYGNYPSNYQVQTTTCRGVQDGCHKSIATVNEILYYKARSGVCAYDGSLPVEVSSALGDEQYSDAVAGSLGNKYYISMKDKSNTPHLFVLDTKRNVWHKEDDIHITDFANCRGDLYFINNDTKQIMTVGGTGMIEPNPIEWEVVTGTMGTDSPDKKYISKIDVRMLLEIGSRVSFYAEYNSSGEWKHLFNMDGVSLKSFSVPVRPERCDHMRLKIVGKGNAKIYSLSKQIEWGSNQ